MNRVFNDYGVFHFVSQSFEPSSSKSSEDSEVQRSVDDLMKHISTVIIDEDESDSFTVRVDSTGFHPNNVAVRKVRRLSVQLQQPTKLYATSHFVVNGHLVSYICVMTFLVFFMGVTKVM